MSNHRKGIVRRRQGRSFLDLHKRPEAHDSPKACRLHRGLHIDSSHLVLELQLQACNIRPTRRTYFPTYRRCTHFQWA